MWRRFNIVLFGVIGIYLISCSSSVKLRFQTPTKPTLIGIKKLVIAPARGGDDAKLVNRFLLALLKQSNYYSIFDQNKFSSALKQNQLTYEKIRQRESTKTIGKLLNIDGIIFTELKKIEILPDEQGVEKVQKSVWTGEYERDEFGRVIEEINEKGEKVKKKKFKRTTVDQHFRIRKGKISVLFQLIDLQQGVEIISQQFADNYSTGKIIKEESQKPPTDDEIKTTLCLNVARKFVTEISPKVEKVKRVIEKGTALVDSGAVYAKQGDWQKSVTLWEQAREISPTDARIYYNLGVAFEAQGDYETAMKYYKQASLLNPKKKLYKSAAENVRKILLQKINNRTNTRTR